MARWQNEPFAIDVKAGETKTFCMCGLSNNGPYCDGSHVTTDKTPEVVTFEGGQNRLCLWLPAIE